MFVKALTAAVGVAVLASTAFTGAAAADTAHLVSRTAVSFNLALGQQPENIVLGPSGSVDVTLAKARQVASITPAGGIRVLATMKAPADKGARVPALHFALTTGLARAGDGTLYFLYASGDAASTGVWRLRPGGAPQRIAALPAAGFPNGLALDEHTGRLYVTDSILGRIFSVSTAGGSVRTFSASPALSKVGFLGANGLRLHNGALWATNLDRGTILRIPILPGDRAGTASVQARHLVGIDDFAFTGRGDDILAALDPPNQIVEVRPGHPAVTVLTAADGLSGPTSIAIQDHSAYIPSAAYVTGKNPNLILAQLPDNF